MKDTQPGGLPALEELTGRQFVLAFVSIVVATGLLAGLGYRVATRLDLRQWWIPLALLGGVAAADFASGLVHWGADTWGRNDCPFIGRRLLVPFRVHHINPHDFLRRRFIDTNGDVALITIPVAAALLAVPLDSRWGAPVAVFGFAFCGIGSLTNQIHQWAHMRLPPRPVRLLQSCRVFLASAAHATHHQGPYDRHYCITTGWCNRPLEAIQFFRRLEFAITQLTGAVARADDRGYEMKFGVRVTEEKTRIG